MGSVEDFGQGRVPVHSHGGMKCSNKRNGRSSLSDLELLKTWRSRRSCRTWRIMKQ